MRAYGYCRVSTESQSLDSQFDALRAAGCARIFRDKLGGTTPRRPGLEAALRSLRPGDTLVVARLDRLGRSLSDLIEIIGAIEKAGAAFRSLAESIDTTTAGGRLVFNIMGSLAQFERQLIVERTLAGLAAAKSRGAVFGRRRKMTARGIITARRQLDSGMKAEAVAALHGVSRSTLYRNLRRS